MPKLDPRIWHAAAMNLVHASHQCKTFGGFARPGANLLATITSTAATATQLFVLLKETVVSGKKIVFSAVGKKQESHAPWHESLSKTGHYAKSFFASLMGIVSSSISQYNTSSQHKAGLYTNKEIQNQNVFYQGLARQIELMDDYKDTLVVFTEKMNQFLSQPFDLEEFEELLNRSFHFSKHQPAYIKHEFERIRGILNCVQEGFLSIDEKNARVKALSNKDDEILQQGSQLAEALRDKLSASYRVYNVKKSLVCKAKYTQLHNKWLDVLSNYIRHVASAYKYPDDSPQLIVDLGTAQSYGKPLQIFEELRELQKQYEELGLEEQDKTDRTMISDEIDRIIQTNEALCKSVDAFLQNSRDTPLGQAALAQFRAEGQKHKLHL